jgi:protein involved in ribonucleotide reduction
MATLAVQAATTVDSSGAAATLNGHVYSAFGVYRVPKSKVAFIARADVVKKQVGVAAAGATNQLTRFIVGASYQLSPNLRVLADWDNLGYKVDPTPLDASRSQALFQIQFTF